MDDDDPDLVIDSDPKNLRSAISVLQAKVRMLTYEMRHNLVHRYEFAPIKLIVYGIAALLMSSVLVAILSYVVRKD